MRKTKHSLRRAVAAVVVAGISVGGPMVTKAATPNVGEDDGAYVRLIGNPADGTVKFQYGWADSTVASNAAGYWIGLYDVTNSHYEWVIETGPMDLPDQFFRNAKPTSELPNGEYKVNFFVRGSYSPVSNLAEIELPFTVNSSD